jgi:hypothetical protein
MQATINFKFTWHGRNFQVQIPMTELEKVSRFYLRIPGESQVLAVMNWSLDPPELITVVSIPARFAGKKHPVFQATILK